jgi:hypothetical protein
MKLEPLLIPEPVIRKHKGRQRCKETQGAILSATLDLLKDKTLREVTADSIAERAGVSKATIYKWWPNKCPGSLGRFSVTHAEGVQVSYLILLVHGEMEAKTYFRMLCRDNYGSNYSHAY